MLLISETEEWRKTHPGAVIGLLELSEVNNTAKSSRLDSRKREIEAYLRASYQGFTRNDFLSLPVISAYKRYYKQYKKTYHVQLQIESIVLKGKNLPNVSPLVDSNFIAELETFVLTAGHDAAKLQEPILIDVSHEGEQMTQMNGAIKVIRGGDMIMRDVEGVCCSVIYGQDNRSPISRDTSHVLYVSYAPADVLPELVDAQLRKIEEYVRLFSPGTVLEQRRLVTSG